MRAPHRILLTPAFGLLFLLATVVVPTAATAQETQDTMKLAAPLRTARAALSAAYTALNGQEASRSFSDSAVVDFQGQVFTGRPAVQEWLSGALQGLSSIRFGTPSFTVAETEVTERTGYTVVTTDGTEQGGSTEATWRRQADGSWKIVRLTVS